MNIGCIFRVHVAKSHSYSTYKRGHVAFITNGFFNNGICGFVTPNKSDKVFDFLGICISAFCETTVHEPPFMGRGNGGSGIVVLEPIRKMEKKELLFYASYMNNYIRWRFSYGRMVTKDRIMNIELPKFNTEIKSVDINKIIPKIRKKEVKLNYNIKFGLISITDLFELHSGDYHNASSLSLGEIPLISCGDFNNGVIKFVKVPKQKIYENTLTIAYNGQPLTTKYHPYKFAAKDDVAVCKKKRELRETTLIFIQYILNREKWRFSYGRKCFREKLSNFEISIPIKRKGEIDEDKIERIINNSTYWDYLKDIYAKGIALRNDIIAN